MGIKKLTPTSPSRRYQTYLTRDELTLGAIPEKSLLEPKKRISGRNNAAAVTSVFIASLILSVTRKAWPDVSARLNTIQIVLLTSP